MMTKRTVELPEPIVTVRGEFGEDVVELVNNRVAAIARHGDRDGRQSRGGPGDYPRDPADGRPATHAPSRSSPLSVPRTRKVPPESLSGGTFRGPVSWSRVPAGG